MQSNKETEGIAAVHRAPDQQESSLVTRSASVRHQVICSVCCAIETMQKEPSSVLAGAVSRWLHTVISTKQHLSKVATDGLVLSVRTFSNLCKHNCELTLNTDMHRVDVLWFFAVLRAAIVLKCRNSVTSSEVDRTTHLILFKSAYSDGILLLFFPISANPPKRSCST